MADCFALFALIHRLTTRHEVVTRITAEVVSDAAADGVLYLELRTTPKARLATPRDALLLAFRRLTTLVSPGTEQPGGGHDQAVVRGSCVGRHAPCRPSSVSTNAALLTSPRPPPGIDASLCGPGGGDGTGIITVRLLLSIDRREGAPGMSVCDPHLPPFDTGIATPRRRSCAGDG